MKYRRENIGRYWREREGIKRIDRRDKGKREETKRGKRER